MIRHDELRDLTADLLLETCNGVAVKPSLQPVSSEKFVYASANTQDGARLDIIADGFWGGSFERSFFDVRVFNPFVQSNSHSPIQATYRHHENLKKQHYEKKDQKSSFTPLVFSTTCR